VAVDDEHAVIERAGDLAAALLFVQPDHVDAIGAVREVDRDRDDRQQAEGAPLDDLGEADGDARAEEIVRTAVQEPRQRRARASASTPG
jgi:hypothetical protein